MLASARGSMRASTPTTAAGSPTFVGEGFIPPEKLTAVANIPGRRGRRPLRLHCNHSGQLVGAGHARPAGLPLRPVTGSPVGADARIRPRAYGGYPFIGGFVGRGLARLTAHNERRQPAELARSCGCLPHRGKHCSLPGFATLNRGPTLTTPHLRGGQRAGRPTFVGEGFIPPGKFTAAANFPGRRGRRPLHLPREIAPYKSSKS